MTYNSGSPIPDWNHMSDTCGSSLSADTVVIAPEGNVLHRPSSTGEGSACPAIAATWHQRDFTEELAARYDVCQRGNCTAYIDKLEPVPNKVVDPGEAPPDWLTEVETPIIETSGGDVLHRPDPTADTPAPACNTEIHAKQWRVRDLTARYAVFHRPCACDHVTTT